MLRCEPWIIAARPLRLAASKAPQNCRRFAFRCSFGSSAVVESKILDRPSAPLAANTSLSGRYEQTTSCLRKAQTFLSRPSARHFPQLETWVDALRDVEGRLQEDVDSTKPCLAIYGVGGTAAAQNLVTTLLEDPLSSDPQQYDAIRERWRLGAETSTELLHFRHSERFSHKDSVIHTASPWLQRLPIDLVELRSNSRSNLKTLFTADVPVIVVDPFINISELLHFLPANPNTILVINCTTGPTSAQYIADKLSEQTGGRSIHTVFVDIERALSSLDILRADSSSVATVQKYQDGFLASNISSFIKTLENTLLRDTSDLRSENVQSIVKHGLHVYQDSLEGMYKDCDVVRSRINELRLRALETREETVKGISEGEGMESTNSLLEIAGKEAQVSLDALSWWKLPMKLDELTQIVSRSVETSSLRKLEAQLVFHAGRLSALQSSLQGLTETTLSSLSPDIDSPILRNTLAQLSSSPSYPIYPTSLTEPLTKRLTQLSFATNRMHLSAQTAIFSTIGTAFASTAAAYLGWTAAYIEGPTALGIVALFTMIALRRAVGKWDRARKRWMQDWQRMGDALQRDLKNAVTERMEQQVLIVPNTACKELENLLEKKLEGYEESKDELHKLLSDLDNIQRY